MKQFLKNNSLTIVMFALFLLPLIGLSFAGWQHQNDERAGHNQKAQSYGAYIISGDFVEAVFENWESEFLQMWALVVLTAFLRQKGAPESKQAQAHSSRLSIIHGRSQRQGTAVRHLLYGHSLGLALLGLFIVSVALHAAGGVSAYNEQAAQHGQQQLSYGGYLASAQFWFESLQNWQSEFLAVGSLLVLSVFLRERGSPQSKPVGESNAKTGS